MNNGGDGGERGGALCAAAVVTCARVDAVREREIGLVRGSDRSGAERINRRVKNKSAESQVFVLFGKYGTETRPENLNSFVIFDIAQAIIDSNAHVPASETR